MLAPEQLNNDFEKKETLKKAQEEKLDESVLRAGESYCRTCKKIYPRVCSGKHSNNAGQEEGKSEESGSGKSGEFFGEDPKELKESKDSKALKHSAPYAKLFHSDKTPAHYVIELIPQGGLNLSEKECDKLLQSMQIDFNEFKKELKNREHDNGYSGKNFNNYWSYINKNNHRHELVFHIPHHSDANEFIQKLQNKYFSLELKPQGRSSVDLEENLEYAKKARTPFRTELQIDKK